MVKSTNKGRIVALALGSALFIVPTASATTELTPIETLGQFLYFDTNLSGMHPDADPAGQSCASCHDPAFGFVDPDSNLPVSEGVIPGRFGGRNSPSAAYAMYSPLLSFNEDRGQWSGGQF